MLKKRVRIVDVSGATLRDIYPGAKSIPVYSPQYADRLGWIVGHLVDSDVPIIQVDDENDIALVLGTDCWWVEEA